MSQNQLNDTLKISDLSIPELEQEIARIEGEQKDCHTKLNDFLAREKPADGVFFAQEIHALKQDKMRLHVEKEFCRKRIARLQFDKEV